jgi:hypothetical protein
MTDGKAKRIANDTQMIFMARTMERLFGSDALDALVEHKQAKSRRNWRRRAAECGRQDPGYLMCLFSEDAHEYEVIRNDPDCLEVKVTRCVHAEVFKSYNAADVGEKLICSGDRAVVEGYNPDMVFERPTTCMTGDCCHFVFRLPKGQGTNGSKA